jgi:hypothetical protein
VPDIRTPNEQVLDSQILWQVLLLRYSLHVRTRLISILNNSEADMAAQIRGVLATEPGLREPSKVAELERLLQQLEQLRRSVWNQSVQVAEEELTALTQTELDHEQDVYSPWLPSLRKPLWLALSAGALAAPFQGRTMRQWIQDAAADETKRIRSAIYAGAGLGERPDVIARRIVGSARAQGTDGATQLSRNHVDTIVRSGVIHVASFVRDQYFRANAQLLTLEQFVAVLDSRTTKICRSLDGHRYAIGVGPVPPLHMNCRSVRYAVLPKDIGGPIPEPEVYSAWIRRQPRAVQVELMGASRLQRMRAGSFDATKFTDYGGKPMTLEQILAAARRLMGEGV